MKTSLSGKIGIIQILFIIIVVSIIAIFVGNNYASNLQTQMTEIWKQAIMDDCANRMKEISVKKKHKLAPAPLSNVKVETEDLTVYLEKDSTDILSDDEGSFLCDQFYLSINNPVKLEKLNELFQFKLKQNGYDFKTMVSQYVKEGDKTEFSNFDDVKFLDDYLKLTYAADIEGVICLEGYVRAGWLESLLWGKTYYISLSIIAFVAFIALVILVIKNKLLKFRKLSAQSNQSDAKNEESPDKTTNLSGDFVQQEEIEVIKPEETKVEETKPANTELEETKLEETELSTIPATESAEDKTDSSLPPTEIVIYMDIRKQILFYSDKSILLSPKLFALFYQLSQGEDYFQPYDYLYEKLVCEKKHLEQWVSKLREKLVETPYLLISTVRASGYQLEGKDNIKIRIERINGKVANDMDEHTD